MKKRHFAVVAGAAILLALAVCFGGPEGVVTDMAVSAASSGTGTKATPVLSPSVATGAGVTAAPESIPTETPTPTAIPAPTPKVKTTSITVSYEGSSVTIGEELDREKVKVYAIQSDGTTEQVDNYSFSTTVVTNLGYNTIVVFYNGCTASFTVEGRRLENVSLTMKRADFGFGNGPGSQDVVITAYYSDGSSEEVHDDYFMYPQSFTRPGLQTLMVIYKGYRAEASVFIGEDKKITAMDVFYDKTELIVGEEILPEELVVTALYEDNSEERINAYTISQSRFDKPGDYEVLISYRGKVSKLKLTVIEKTPLSIRARYTGPEVEVGSAAAPSDFEVYVEFNTGKEERVTDFTLQNYVIKCIGENTVRVSYGACKVELTVTGCDYSEPDYSHADYLQADSNGMQLRIVAALPRVLEPGSLALEGYVRSKLVRVYRKLKIKDGEFLGFTIGFKNGDDEVYLPIMARITLPSEFIPSRTDIYYTPNRKTIVGMIPKTEVGPGVFEVTFFKTGTYLIVCNNDPDPAADPRVNTEKTK